MQLNLELWTNEEIDIFRQFGGKCIKCPRQAVTLHEIIPKSRRPKTWMEKKNRVPICNICHTWAHNVSCRVSGPILKELRDERP